MDLFIPLRQEIMKDLRWWLNRENTLKGLSLIPFQAQKVIYTDASNAGLGATLEEKELTGVWTPLEREMHLNN